jgi:GNAT superfamily N-acetyltransferase
MHITIREAALDDLDILCEMIADLFSIEDDFEINKEKQIAALTLLIKRNTGGVIFIADADSLAAGMINLQKIISTAAGGFSVLLEDLYVKNELRNKGIGGMLLERAALWGKEEQAIRIQLGADIRNKSAINFYSNRGFIRSNMALHYKML